MLKSFTRYAINICFFSVLTINNVWSGQSEKTFEKVWLLPTINQQKYAEALLFLKDNQGNFFIKQQDWIDLGLNLPANEPIQVDSKNYYVVNNIKDLKFEVNTKKSTISILADTIYFQKTIITNPQRSFLGSLLNQTTGAYINYDISLLNSDDMTLSQSFIENVLFSNNYTIENTIISKNTDTHQKTIRLNTLATYNLPQKNIAIKLGDTITSEMGLGHNIRFMGLKFGTDFSLQPSVINSPQISISGKAVLPSTVDIFINNIKRFTQTVPVGEFSIQDMPVISGQGVAQMVITDMMGRKQEIIQPYYSNPKLLKKGLIDYSYQLGVVRENYGIDSNNYGDIFSNMSFRYGLNNQLTLELNNQLLEQQQALTLGAVATILNSAILRTAFSASHHQNIGAGYAYSLATEHHNSDFSVGSELKYYSSDYANMANASFFQPKYQTQIYINKKVLNHSALSAIYTQQKDYQHSESEILQVGYNVGLKKYGNISLSAIFSNFNHKNDNFYQLTYSIPLAVQDRNKSFTAFFDEKKQGVNLQDRPNASTGYGYMLKAEHGSTNNIDFNLDIKTHARDYGLKVSHINQDDLFELKTVGSFSWLDKHVFSGQRIDQAFALVSVPSFKNIRVYHDNRLVGKTNQQGNILVSKLRPYQKNNLRIELEDFPFDTTIKRTQQVVYPNYRQGLVVDFPAQKSFGAKMILKQSSGEFIPSGAIIYNLATNESFKVGINGLAYLTGVTDKQQQFMVKWSNKQCQLSLSALGADNYLANLGEIVCDGVVEP